MFEGFIGSVDNDVEDMDAFPDTSLDTFDLPESYLFSEISGEVIENEKCGEDVVPSLVSLANSVLRKKIGLND